MSELDLDSEWDVLRQLMEIPGQGKAWEKHRSILGGGHGEGREHFQRTIGILCSRYTMGRERGTVRGFWKGKNLPQGYSQETNTGVRGPDVCTIGGGDF